MLLSEQVKVRELCAADQPAWADLWTAYLTYYETSVPAAVYQSTFERLLGDDPREFNCLVAELDGKLVGLIHYLFHRHAWKTEEVCYLQDLFVSPDVRGKSLGRALIEAVYDAADTYGAPTVYWLTQDFNAAGRRLYDRVGTLTPFIKYQR